MRISHITNEDASGLNIGDPVIITGNVQFKGKTGDIVDFGKDNRFVVVNLYNYGKHSFHASDVSYNDYVDSDAEEADAYDRDSDARNWVHNQEVGESKTGTKFVGKWKGTDSAAKAKQHLVGEAKSLQSKFEKHLARHGYDVGEKSKYWEKKLKDIDAQIAAWDAEMAARKQGKETTNEGFGSYYYEQLAQAVYANNPGLDTSGSADDLVSLGYEIAADEIGNKKARHLFAYDEDFASDFVSAYSWLQQGGAKHIGEDDDLNVGIEAYGVRGAGSKKWRKKFKSQTAFEKWLDANDGDVEVLGTREVNLNDMFEQGVAEGKAVYYHVVDDNNKSIKAFMYSQDAIKFVNDRRKKDPTANKWKVVAKKNAVIGEQGVAEGSEILKAGLPVRVPHKGKMVPGKIVRYDSGKGGYSPAYVVDIGEYESKLVPVYDVKQGVAEGEYDDPRWEPREPDMSRKVDWDIEAERNAPAEQEPAKTVTVRDNDGNVVLQFPSTGGFYGDLRYAASKGIDTDSGEYHMSWKKDANEDSCMSEASGATSEQVASEIVRRIINRHKDAITAFGPEAIMAAAREVGEFFAGAEELGTSDISIATKYTLDKLDQMSRGALGESASGGCTGAGAIATTPTGGAGKNVGSLFGGSYKQKRTKKSPGTK